MKTLPLLALASSLALPLFHDGDSRAEPVSLAPATADKPAVETMSLEQLLAEFHHPDEILSRPPPQRRIDVINALRRAGPPLLAKLRAELGDSSPTVQIAAAQVLANLGQQAGAAVPELVRAMRHPDEHVRVWAVIAAGPLREPGAYHSLVLASRDASARVRTTVLQYATPSLSDGSFATAAEALNDSDKTVRKAALYHLKMSKDKRAVPLLAEQLHDTEVHDYDVRDGNRTANRNCDEAVLALEHLVHGNFQMVSKGNQEANDRKVAEWQAWWKANEASFISDLHAEPALVRPTR